jgi:hypothetical protein
MIKVYTEGGVVTGVTVDDLDVDYELIDYDEGRYVCVNGHDLCSQMYANADCPYCEFRKYEGSGSE